MLQTRRARYDVRVCVYVCEGRGMDVRAGGRVGGVRVCVEKCCSWVHACAKVKGCGACVCERARV